MMDREDAYSAYLIQKGFAEKKKCYAFPKVLDDFEGGSERTTRFPEKRIEGQEKNTIFPCPISKLATEEKQFVLRKGGRGRKSLFFRKAGTT